MKQSSFSLFSYAAIAEDVSMLYKDFLISHAPMNDPSQLFETFCIMDEQVLRWPFHLARMKAACLQLGWHDWSEDMHHALNEACKALPRSSKRQRIKGRCVYNHSGIVELTFSPYTPRQVRRLRSVAADALDYSLKTTDRTAINQCFSQKEDCDDVVILREGLLTDTSIANIALWHTAKQQWLTPEHPLLRGTHRAALLRNGTIFLDAHLTTERLSEFSHLRLFNALLQWGEIELPLHALRTC